MNSFEEKLLLGAAVLAGGYFAIKHAGQLIANVVPPVVKEGAEATGILAEQAVHIVANPFDAFGITSATTGAGVPYWQPTTPQANTDDVVSNNDSGINYNYF